MFGVQPKLSLSVVICTACLALFPRARFGNSSPARLFVASRESPAKVLALWQLSRYQTDRLSDNRFVTFAPALDTLLGLLKLWRER
jgi:hypothetical protein